MVLDKNGLFIASPGMTSIGHLDQDMIASGFQFMIEDLHEMKTASPGTQPLPTGEPSLLISNGRDARRSTTGLVTLAKSSIYLSASGSG